MDGARYACPKSARKRDLSANVCEDGPVFRIEQLYYKEKIHKSFTSFSTVWIEKSDHSSIRLFWLTRGAGTMIVLRFIMIKATTHSFWHPIWAGGRTLLVCSMQLAYKTGLEGFG